MCNRFIITVDTEFRNSHANEERISVESRHFLDSSLGNAIRIRVVCSSTNRDDSGVLNDVHIIDEHRLDGWKVEVFIA